MDSTKTNMFSRMCLYSQYQIWQILIRFCKHNFDAYKLIYQGIQIICSSLITNNSSFNRNTSNAKSLFILPFFCSFIFLDVFLAMFSGLKEEWLWDCPAIRTRLSSRRPTTIRPSLSKLLSVKWRNNNMTKNWKI